MLSRLQYEEHSNLRDLNNASECSALFFGKFNPPVHVTSNQPTTLNLHFIGIATDQDRAFFRGVYFKAFPSWQHGRMAARPQTKLCPTLIVEAWQHGCKGFFAEKIDSSQSVPVLF